MPHWDEDSPLLRRNLVQAQRAAAAHAMARRKIELVTLQPLLVQLDTALQADRLDRLGIDDRRAVAEFAAWAHGEWVRIHPFANGNGRTARMLGNAILVRYGLPPVFRLRPRPLGSYATAATASMDADHLPMADYVTDQIDRWEPGRF